MYMDYVWECQPKAEMLVEQLLNACCEFNPDLSKLGMELHHAASSRLFDWIDHVVAAETPLLVKELQESGFKLESQTPSFRIYQHPGAQLPRVVMDIEGRVKYGAAVLVESIADFLSVRGISREIAGSIFSPLRICKISAYSDHCFWIVERRGTSSLEPFVLSTYPLENYFKALELWQTRPRDFEDDDLGMQLTLDLAQQVISLVGKDTAASIVLECERKYWQARNTAGQIQKNRQDRLGMGWANHDHHTFRSSRRHFASLVSLFESLGFHCRERFYAGSEAGWGAQVMENPRGKFVLFLDVDLSPEEIAGDFSHEPLPELNALGTIGLWCGLHGDSILKAGMHHLEAQFLFDELKEDLAKDGIQMMQPFSFFPFLKQAFTKGENWAVSPKRVELLLKKKLITSEQAQQFLSQGAVGSHLENLQRREGYKGFNQKNVSQIIKLTDPRIIK